MGIYLILVKLNNKYTTLKGTDESSVPFFIFPDCINCFPDSINQSFKVYLALRHENKKSKKYVESSAFTRLGATNTSSKY